MKVGFTFTNYNNSALSIQAAQSIAANHGDCDYEIVLVDNASTEQERRVLAEPGVLPAHCRVIWNTENVGYFNGLNIGMAALRHGESDFDAIVIGNNDLVFEPDFFEAMQDPRVRTAMQRHAVLSPSIVTLDNVPQNPHVIGDISRFREIVWDLYFSNFTLSRVIAWTARVAGSLVSRKDFQSHAEEGAIYQGYGACYIMTPRFFERYGALWSPGFVMGEEFYLARQLKANGEQMYYLPAITVRHHDHATVSKLPSRRLWDMTRQYHAIYRFFVSPYRPRMDNDKTPADYERQVKGCS